MQITPKLKSSMLQMLAICASTSYYGKCAISRGESHSPKDYGVYLLNKKRGKRK